MPHDYSGMSREELEAMHGEFRATMAMARAEMDAIEAVLLPLHAHDSAKKKLARAGLSPAEIKALVRSHNETAAADDDNRSQADAARPPGGGDATRPDGQREGDVEVQRGDDKPPPKSTRKR